LLPITIKAVQEQQQQIDELKKANAERTKINAEILKRLEKLENN
jgi:nitrate/TMAO reductase-like tetraheme cytochrome c subunit